VRGVLSVVGTFVGITTMVTATADNALAPLYYFADVKYDDTFWHMNGDVGITGLKITPLEGAASEQVAVERITVHTPGFLWLARAAAATRRNAPPEIGADGALEPTLPAMDRVGLTVEGRRFSAESYFPEELAWVGVDSAAPFEAAGCGSEDYFSSGELRDMGLPDSRQRLRLMVEATSWDVVRVSAELVAPEVSSIRIERSMRTSNAERYITLLAEGIPQEEGKHIDTVVRVEDAGFVKARNRLCASRLSLSEDAFIERHVAAVTRLALVFGAVPADDFVAAYRDYAANGGSFEIRSRPMTNIPEEDWGQFTPEDQFKLRNVTYTRGAQELPLAMSFVEPRPLPAAGGVVSLADEVGAELELERALAAGMQSRGAAARARSRLRPRSSRARLRSTRARNPAPRFATSSCATCWAAESSSTRRRCWAAWRLSNTTPNPPSPCACTSAAASPPTRYRARICGASSRCRLHYRARTCPRSSL
jgi:hypothetical protein